MNAFTPPSWASQIPMLAGKVAAAQAATGEPLRADPAPGPLPAPVAAAFAQEVLREIHDPAIMAKIAKKPGWPKGKPRRAKA